MSLINKALCKICLCMFPILLVSGCSSEPQKSGETEIFIDEWEEQDEYDLTAQEWRNFQEIQKTEPGLTVTGYFDGFGKDPDPGMRRYEGYSVTDQENYYRIQGYIIENDYDTQYEYFLHSVDTAALEAKTVRLALEELEDVDGSFGNEENKSIYLVGADISDGKLCAYFVIWNNEEQDYAHYLAVWMDRNGSVGKMVDILPAIVENRKQPANADWFPTSVVYDPSGYYYVIDGSSREIMILNENGEKLDLIGLQDCREMAISVTCKAPDESPIFEYESVNGNTVIFSLTGAKMTILFSDQGNQANIRKVDSYGRVIYLDNGQLLYWNASKGQCKCIYNADGINSLDCAAIMGSVDEELILVFEDRNGSYLYKLQSASDFEPKEIMLLQWRDDEYTKNCASEYSRKHPGIVITVHKSEDNSDVSFVRVVEDMKAGNGPDMLVIAREQLMEMEKAGVLADLSNLLPDRIQDQIFSGVLQYGIVGDRLYGIPYEASIETLLVSEEIWSGDSWTVQNIEELLKQTPTAKRCISISSSLTADQMLYSLCLQNLEGSNFIDLKQLTSRFDTEDFRSLLALCREYGEMPGSRNYMTDSERREEVLGGEALAYSLTGGFVGFSRERAMFDDSFHCVGLPANGKNGSIVSCYSCVAVNDRSENVEIIEDFLQFLLSEDCQVAYTVNWVRKDVLADHVRENTGQSEGPVFIKNDHSVIPLEGRADGSSYLEEYLNLMEDGAIICTEYDILNIILEEASAYFSDDKSVQETADVIQKRVQNYLDERK